MRIFYRLEVRITLDCALARQSLYYKYIQGTENLRTMVQLCAVVRLKPGHMYWDRDLDLKLTL